MSPTVFRVGPYRFYFFSREEEKSHVHVTCSEGEAKFWLEPAISLAASTGLSKKQLNDIHRIVESRRDDIARAWNEHFKA
jgi:Domain of unknown function (DUF4160)